MEIENNCKTEDSTYNRVKQTILHGSLYEAFYNKFIDLFDVLKYLLSDKPENESQRKKMCIAYRIVCIFLKEQIIDSNHFICLTENEDYISIYSLSFNNYFNNKINKDYDMNIEITRKIQNIFPKLIKETEYSRFFYVLCDIVTNFKDDEIEIVAFTRNIKSLININKGYVHFLNSDYLLPLEDISHIYAESLGFRCNHLYNIAPLYWKYVGYKLYLPFVEKCYPKAQNFTKDMIEIYSKCFPNLYPDSIINRSEVVISISNLDKEIQAYILGFPIHKYMPSDYNLNKALDKLQELGVDGYCSIVNSSDIISSDIKISNTENVHFEKIDEFVDFDVVSYYTDNEDSDGKHLFRFTRPEFKNILKDKKNFYTGEFLPFFVIEKIKSRFNIANEYNLPKSKTLNDLLNDIENLSVESEDYDEEEEDDEDEEERYFVGRSRDQETGVESFFRIPFGDLDTEEVEEVIEEMLNDQGIDFLGRAICQCPNCIIFPSSEDENCINE